MKEQLVFDVAMDALLRAAGSPLTPRCVERLHAAAFNVNDRLHPSYPASVWADAVRILGEETFADLAPHEAHRRLGERSLDAFVQGPMGAARLVLRIIGPSRILGRLTKSLRIGCNYLEVRTTQVGPRAFEVHLSEVLGVEGFYRGMLEAGMRHVGVPGFALEVASCDGHACTFRASWDE